MLKDMEVCPRCNRAEFAHKRRSSVCSWCCAHLTKRSLDKYHYEPFLWYRRHSPEAVRLHVKAISQWPHLSTARWEPEQRQLILRYLAWSDDSRCGLCAMPLPVGQPKWNTLFPRCSAISTSTASASSTAPPTSRGCTTSTTSRQPTSSATVQRAIHPMSPCGVTPNSGRYR